jgi:hypothetical protein
MPACVATGRWCDQFGALAPLTVEKELSGDVSGSFHWRHFINRPGLFLRSRMVEHLFLDEVGEAIPGNPGQTLRLENGE